MRVGSPFRVTSPPLLFPVSGLVLAATPPAPRGSKRASSLPVAKPRRPSPGAHRLLQVVHSASPGVASLTKREVASPVPVFSPPGEVVAWCSEGRHENERAVPDSAGQDLSVARPLGRGPANGGPRARGHPSRGDDRRTARRRRASCTSNRVSTRRREPPRLPRRSCSTSGPSVRIAVNSSWRPRSTARGRRSRTATAWSWSRCPSPIAREPRS